MTIKHYHLADRVRTRYRYSPYVQDLAAFADWLVERGYNLRYARLLVFHTMRALEAFGHPAGRTWAWEELDRAFRRARKNPWERNAQRDFGIFLQSVGRLPAPRENGPHASVLAAYRRHLVEVRGLASSTIKRALWEVRGFLRYALDAGKPLKQLTGETIEQYIKHRSHEIGRHSLRGEVCSLRAFMGYCFHRRLVTRPPEAAFDRPVSFDGEMPPRALDWSLIGRFLQSIDRTSGTGWRDSMMLHLMAYYGLRPGEITRLKVNSIDWTAQTLLVEQEKTHSWLILPLLKRTVDFLRRYLREGRHERKHPVLFAKAVAPYGPMTRFNVSRIFKFHARKSGLPIAHASAYALRHSFAMRLFARGVGIKAIGDLMGHNSLSSTTVYLRLQTDTLREVALPVPTTAMLRGGAK